LFATPSVLHAFVSKIALELRHLRKRILVGLDDKITHKKKP
jgi:hypothetical protein